MENLDEKISAIRNSGLKHLSKKHPNISRKIEDGGYFIAAISAKDIKGVFVVVYFTSKQEEHIDDAGKYSNMLYKKFGKKIYRC